ncbi:MAG: hypothetical protein WAX69_14360 [Victivallales bacterium]
MDFIFNNICHHAGAHPNLMPLCLRCSCVYAGVLLGLAYELILFYCTGRREAPLSAVLESSGAMLFFSAIGFFGIYGLFAVPLFLNCFSALYFGAALAFLSLFSISRELRLRDRGQRYPIFLRIGMWSTLFLLALLFAGNREWGFQVLGILSVAGLALVFILVNFALSLPLFRRVSDTKRRVLLALLSVPFPLIAEFAVFHLWRSL